LKASVIPVAAVSAAASIFCVRSGALTLAFLVPLALAGFVSGIGAGFLASVLAVLAEGGILYLYWQAGAGLTFLLWNGLYFSVMVLIFCWSNAGPGRMEKIFDIPRLYRSALGALAVTALIVPAFVSLTDDADFVRFAAEQFGAISGMGALDLNAEEIVRSISYVGMRGGILCSIFLFFAISRQIALFIASLIKRERLKGSLITFHTGPYLIWALSFSLGGVLLGKYMNLAPLEIPAWNILAVCAILYLAQGGGIALYYLVRLPPLLRLAVNIAILFLLFRPGFSPFILGALVFAGILENWVPLRAPANKGPPPTPEA
jgi:hypothetical protein